MRITFVIGEMMEVCGWWIAVTDSWGERLFGVGVLERHDLGLLAQIVHDGAMALAQLRPALL